MSLQVNKVMWEKHVYARLSYIISCIMNLKLIFVLDILYIRLNVQFIFLMKIINSILRIIEFSSILISYII